MEGMIVKLLHIPTNSYIYSYTYSSYEFLEIVTRFPGKMSAWDEDNDILRIHDIYPEELLLIESNNG